MYFFKHKETANVIIFSIKNDWQQLQSKQQLQLRAGNFLPNKE